ncbi:Ion-translocating oxidoreductase complex subunit E, partial [Aphis craccivora]
IISVFKYNSYFYVNCFFDSVFIPLIVTNCIVIGRAESIAYKNSILVSFFDGLLTGLGSTLAMFFIGLIREILGHGTFLFGIHKIFNNLGTDCFFKLFNKDIIILIASPPGGFLVLDKNKEKKKKKCLKCIHSSFKK